LTNFRRCPKEKVIFSPKINLIIGPNASGKTNLLEGIFLLSRGVSFKAETNRQLITWKKDFALIEGVVEKAENNLVSLGVKITPSSLGRAQKTFWINGVKKTRKEFLAQLLTVLFRPEDIRIISGSPSRRRDFLNAILTSTDWRYQQNLRLYKRALKQRNELLDKIRDRRADVKELYYWNKTLVKNGQFITQARREFVAQVNSFLENHPKKEIGLFSLNYRSSVITEEKLARNLDTDLRFGWTSFGPHKDDFYIEDKQFKTKNKNIASWGSRAQQRMAVLALKLAELDFLTQKTGHQPVLLLDDIFSELDQKHQQLLTQIFDRFQVIITAARKPSFDHWRPDKTITLKERSDSE